MFKAILRVASGNFLEMYDFMVFAYFAPEISRAFFPTDSAVGSLLLTFATFGAGYLMRPLGAVMLGSYFDRHGRREGLLLTLGLMSIGTLTIAVMPSYTTIGLAAPLLVLAGRLVQGFSAGAELGGVSVYLSEIAPPGRKGFFVSWQSASQQVAVIFASLLGAILAKTLGAPTMEDWGWRIPLGIGCLIIPFLFWIRSGLKETDHFLQRTERHGFRAIWRSVFLNWKIVFTGAALSLMSSVSFYFITAYTPTFGREALHLDPFRSLLASLLVGASNLFWLPISGVLSDRIGRKRILLVASFVAAVSAYPALLWLSSDPSYGRLLAVELWLSLLYGFYNGTLICYLTEIMPASIRTTGFSLAYSLAVCAGGFTPFFCTWLIERTGSMASPGWWLTAAALAGCGAAKLAP
jgi:MFS family permease